MCKLNYFFDLEDVGVVVEWQNVWESYDEEQRMFDLENCLKRQKWRIYLVPDVRCSEEVVQSFDIVLDYHIVSIVAFWLFFDKCFFKILWKERLDIGWVLLEKSLNCKIGKGTSLWRLSLADFLESTNIGGEIFEM